MQMYQDEAREIPVIGEVDVLVAGGGPAGIAAALGAARNEARTMIVDEYNCFGGMLTSGMMSHWTGDSEAPIMDELDKRCREMAPPNEDMTHAVPHAINHESMKLAIFDLLEEAGVRMRLHTRVADAIVEHGAVRGVIFESKSGREAVLAKVVIDATGDGDVAARAGAEFLQGRDGDQGMQPVTLMFKIAGVDLARAITPGSFESRVNVPKGEIQALARKILPAPAGHVLLYPASVPGEVVVNMTNLTGINGADAEDLTRAEIICHRQIPKIVNFLREYAPGYENCYLLAAAACVGVRETRHFRGLYQLTAEDIVEARVFEDWIATRNFFNFDIHNVSGAGLDKNGAQHHFQARGRYTIPYRCCVPEKLDGLLLAGRNISGTHKAHSNFRVMPICANVGLGVGVAAAQAAKQGLAPREVEVSEVQNVLSSWGIRI